MHGGRLRGMDPVKDDMTRDCEEMKVFGWTLQSTLRHRRCWSDAWNERQATCWLAEIPHTELALDPVVAVMNEDQSTKHKALGVGGEAVREDDLPPSHARDSMMGYRYRRTRQHQDAWEGEQVKYTRTFAHLISNLETSPRSESDPTPQCRSRIPA